MVEALKSTLIVQSLFITLYLDQLTQLKILIICNKVANVFINNLQSHCEHLGKLNLKLVHCYDKVIKDRLRGQKEP